MKKKYFIYIITNRAHRALYTGVTNNLARRAFEHKEKLISGFSSKYNVNKLVYYEEFSDILEALTREKQIKGGSREKKIDLIIEENPNWNDLYNEIASVANAPSQ